MGEKHSMSRILDEFNIHIASDGRWFHEGGEIRRKAIVKLFASVLTKDAKGNATDYKLNFTVKFIMLSKNKEVTYKESFKIKKNDKNFSR